MPNGIIGIEEFEKLTDVNVKLNILFKTSIFHIQEIEKRFEAGKERFEKLENRKVKDKIYATIGGVIGGALAAVGIKIGS